GRSRWGAGELLGGHEIPDAIRSVLEPRLDDLAGFQSLRYARRHLRAVLAVLGAEQELAPGPLGSAPLPVTVAFAAGLHKLMAYKDEYEVARLHLDAMERARLDDAFGPGARTRVMLHPPLLRALGLRHKISLGPASSPVFGLLHAARHLRGTPFDPFGYTGMRRTERSLVTEYRRLVDQAITHLSPATAGEVAKVARLPDLIRGYEGVKREGIDRFRIESTALLRSLTGVASTAAQAPCSRRSIVEVRAP
ncbi:MAG: DUF6537 domain-containing protein, partial [Acidimicrobiales bacterium]